jgi:heme/copper-type cytochrome/quinol oxidase subunit 2
MSMSIEDDPVLGRFFDSAEKKARWVARLRLLYLLWIVFVVIGVFVVLLWFVFG